MSVIENKIPNTLICKYSKKKKRNIITERKKILNANRLQYLMIVNLKIQNQTDNFFVIYKLKFTQKEQELWVRKVINKLLLYKDRQTNRQTARSSNDFVLE